MFPDAKLKVVDALKANGEIVAMTGDGVNDGPALKSSHIGIAMGDKGTEIAKNAADLVLTDDDLNKITEAIRQGRNIYNNFKKATRYIISIHIPIILTASLPVLLGWRYPNIFTPVHIIFLELIMGPTCSIFYGQEPAEANLLQRPPRLCTANMFSGSELAVSIVQGLAITAAVLGIYYRFMMHGFTIEYVRAAVFTTLLWSNVLLTFANRSFTETFAQTVRYKNNLVPLILVASAIFLLCISLAPFFRDMFRLSLLSGIHYAACMAAAFAVVAWFEAFKAFNMAGVYTPKA
jgi:Ca2+-transporting ATPase